MSLINGTRSPRINTQSPLKTAAAPTTGQKKCQTVSCCANLEDYFPRESFIQIDIDRPEWSLERIGEIIRNDEWERRIPALKESRNLILYKYQIFPYLSELIGRYAPGNVEKTDILIPAYSSKRLIHQLKYMAESWQDVC